MKNYTIVYEFDGRGYEYTPDEGALIFAIANIETEKRFGMLVHKRNYEAFVAMLGTFLEDAELIYNYEYLNKLMPELSEHFRADAYRQYLLNFNL